MAMAMTETQLKDIIKSGKSNLYLFYGAEGYLVEQYARLVAKYTVEEGFDAFNLQRFDGKDATIEQLEAAVDAVPLMSDRKCVMVRDGDPCGADGDRLCRLAESVPEDCVLVFWQMTVQPDKRKNGWKTLLAVVESRGVAMNFPRKDAADAAKMLVGGAKRRGCALDVTDALYLVEQVGNDLNLLICELDRLCALVTDGRFSGSSRGPCIGHVSPEAAAGGPIGAVKDGDKIIIDINNRTLTLCVPEEEIQKRLAEVKHIRKERTPALDRYSYLVTSADRGAVLKRPDEM